MNRKKYDAVATIGEYTTKSGEKKKRYTTIGSVFEVSGKSPKTDATRNVAKHK